MKLLPLFCLISILAVCAGAVQASEEIYKWVDEDGVTHYSARPPEGIEYQRMTTEVDRAVARTESTETTESDEQSEQEERRRTGNLPELAEIAAEEPDPELVAERCEQARYNLTWLTERTRISVEGEDGTMRRLSEEERQSQIQENQAFLDEWC